MRLPVAVEVRNSISESRSAIPQWRVDDEDYGGSDVKLQRVPRRKPRPQDPHQVIPVETGKPALPDDQPWGTPCDNESEIGKLSRDTRDLLVARQPWLHSSDPKLVLRGAASKLLTDRAVGASPEPPKAIAPEPGYCLRRLSRARSP